MTQAKFMNRVGLSAVFAVCMMVGSTSVLALDGADLTVTITDGLTAVSPGATMLYTVSASNIGNLASQNDVVKASIPANTTVVAGSISDGGSVQGGFVVWPTFTLASQANTIRQFTLQLASPLPTPAPTTIAVTATIAGTDTNGNADINLANNSATDTDSITPPATTVDLSIAQSNGVTACVPGGQTLMYTLTICNICTTLATGVIIYDVIPNGTDYVSSSDGGVYNPSTRTITWPAITLNSGTSVTRSFTVKVQNPPPAGQTDITNFVGVKDDGTHGSDSNLSNNTSSLTNDLCPLAPDLAMEINTVQACLNQFVTFTYTLKVSNASGGASTGVVVTDAIPTNATFVSASDGGTITNGVVTFPTFNLPAMSVALRTVVVGVQQPLVAPTVPISLQNTASVHDDGVNGADANGSNNTAVVSNQVSNLHFVSDPTANPNPAVIGVPESFTAVAQDDANPNAPITYMWDFGDGTSGTGSSLTHTYSVPGPFTIKLSVSNGIGCPLGFTFDRATAGTRNPAVTCKLLRAPFDLTKTNNDSLTLVAQIVLPSDFKPAGHKLSINIANYSINAVLDANGKAIGLPKNQSMQLRVNGALSLVTLKVTKSNLRTQLAPGVPVSAKAATIPNQIFVIAFDIDKSNADTFGGALTTTYVSNGKKGSIGFSGF